MAGSDKVKIYNNPFSDEGLPSLSIEPLGDNFHIRLYEDVSFVFSIGDITVNRYTIRKTKIEFPLGELKYKRIVEYV